MSDIDSINSPKITKDFGTLHPINQTKDYLLNLLANFGFEEVHGPEIETEEFNFDMLNIKKTHPARQMHDTFYVEGKKNVLRTHTSPVQIRTMLNGKPPFKIIVPGRTYRCDSDQTHAPMFHQLEGLHIDKDITMAHLKGCLNYFIREFFEVKKIKMRFRPSHFPFTEPSAEVDIGYKIKNGKIALKTKEKILSVVNAVDEITYIEERDEDSIIFSFQEKSYEVVIKHIDSRELNLLLNEIKSAIPQ